MQFCFENKDLASLYYEDQGSEKYPESVVNAFFKKMQQIRNAKNENDLRAIKGNHFEKLEGGSNTYSIRLNGGYRLLFGLSKDGAVTILAVREISNHYE